MEQATLVRHAVKEPPGRGLTDGPDHAVATPRSWPAPGADEVMGELTPGAFAARPQLSTEEIELLAEIATGVTTEVAARRLELSARTLRRRLRTVCDRLEVNTPIEAAVWAARRQMI